MTDHIDATIKRVPLSPEIAEAVANAKDADEMFEILNSAADGQLTEEMTLQEALIAIGKVSASIESLGD